MQLEGENALPNFENLRKLERLELAHVTCIGKRHMRLHSMEDNTHQVNSERTSRNNEQQETWTNKFRIDVRKRH